MKTILLLTDSPDTQRLLAEIVGPEANLVLLPMPSDPTRERFDSLFATWLRMTEAVIVDAAALGAPSRFALDALAAAHLEDDQAIVVRASNSQLTMWNLPAGWLVVSDKDAYDQLKQALLNYFELRRTQAKLKRADAVLVRHQQTSNAGLINSGGQQPNSIQSAPASVATSFAYDLYQYRDALKSISRVLGLHPDERSLMAEFFQLVRELLGVGKLAIFTRPVQTDLFQGQSAPLGNRFAVSISSGIAPEVVEHLRLTLEGGIGRLLSREAKILRRQRFSDPLSLDFDSQATREFELLGTEVAVPIFDNDQLLGVLTFSGKITGEPLTNEDLELVYHLMTHLAQAIRNLHLLDQVSGQRRFMSEVLANVQSGVVVIGQDGRILNLNPRARLLLDVGEREMVGQNISRLPSRVADVIFESLQTGREIRKREVKLSANRILSVSATRFAASVSANDTDKGSLVAIGLLDDLTQIKLQEAQARALADNQFIARLAFRLSHELKNAMVSVKTFAQLLPGQIGDKEFCEQFSREVSSDVNRMDAVINTLAFFAQPLQLVCEEVELSDIFDLVLGNIINEFDRKRAARVVAPGEKAGDAGGLPVINVSKRFAQRAARLQADKIRLIQAFEHVLRNAVQAMPRGGRISINVVDATANDLPEGVPVAGAIKIECQDSGEGIPLDTLKKVTDPFMTTRNVGVGLGLTIVRKILEMHGGHLLLDSILGRGTTVTMILPLQPHSPPENIVPDPVNTVAEPAPKETSASREIAPSSRASTVPVTLSTAISGKP